MKKNTQKKRFQTRGFSLIEILIVMGLIGIIVAGIMVTVTRSSSRAKSGIARNQAYDIAKVCEEFQLEYGRYPSASEGIQILVKPPHGEPYLDKTPVDPWSNEFIYTYPGVKNKGRPDIRSKGPDGIENTDDDVGNWSSNE